MRWHLTGCMLNPHHHPAVSGCCSHLTDEETEASLLVHLFQDLDSPLWLVHEALDSRLNLRPLLWCHADLTLYPREPVAHSIDTCGCSQPSHLVCISPQAVGMLQACTCAPESSGSESPSEAGLGQCPSGTQSREGWCAARARGLVPGEESSWVRPRGGGDRLQGRHVWMPFWVSFRVCGWHQLLGQAALGMKST